MTSSSQAGHHQGKSIPGKRNHCFLKKKGGHLRNGVRPEMVKEGWASGQV